MEHSNHNHQHEKSHKQPEDNQHHHAATKNHDSHGSNEHHDHAGHDKHAIQYGTCAGLKLIGWNYPKGNSLNYLIDKTGLYPLTALTSLTKKEKQRLLSSNIVLCKEILINPEVLVQAAIAKEKLVAILQEAKELCKNFNEAAQQEKFK